MKWFDSRLHFNNLKSVSRTLNPKEINRIWFPFFKFDNTRNKEISLLDSKSLLKVSKEGNGVLTELHRIENKFIFDGKENPISYQRFYSLDFECEFNLRQGFKSNYTLIIPRLNSVKNTNFGLENKKSFLTHSKIVFGVTDHFCIK